MKSKTYAIKVNDVDDYNTFKYKVKARSLKEALTKAYYKYGAFVRSVTIKK